MDSEITKSLSRVVLLALQHCCRKRLADYSTSGLSVQFMNEVGSEMVNLFEQRYREWKSKTPPETGAPIGGVGGAPGRQRGRCQ